jgi:hypothetical protein
MDGDQFRKIIVKFVIDMAHNALMPPIPVIGVNLEFIATRAYRCCSSKSSSEIKDILEVGRRAGGLMGTALACKIT